MKNIFLAIKLTILFFIGLNCYAADPVDSSGLDYVLTEMDVVSVQVFGEPDLSSQAQRIDGSGRIRMGLIATIEVAGMTLREAEKRIEGAYVDGRYLRSPQVTIQVGNYAAKYISILGEVASPGRLQLEDESSTMRVVDAISAVGGFTGIAKSDAVRITRRDSSGKERTVVVDVDDLIDGKGREIPEDFHYLLPGDIVNVPERLF
jgi:polysaccharide export outer membrane protein